MWERGNTARVAGVVWGTAGIEDQSALASVDLLVQTLLLTMFSEQLFLAAGECMPDPHKFPAKG